MSGKLIRNIIFLFIINLVIKPLWTFGIDIPAQNQLGQIVFGQYASLLSLSLIFQIILDLGLQTYQSRQVGSNNQSIQWLLPNSIAAKAVLSIIYLTILMVVGWLLKYNTYQLFLLCLLGVSLVFNSLMLYLRSSIASLHFYATDSIISIIDKLIVILICGSILYQWIEIPFRIEYLIYGQLAGYMISGIVCFGFIIKHTQLEWHYIQWNRIRKILKKSIPYAVQILIMAVFFRIDIVILEKLTVNSRPQEAGHYWEAFRLLDMMNNFTGVLFAGLYLPMVMKFKKQKDKLIQITHTGLNILLPVSLTICILAYFFHFDIMMLLYPTHEHLHSQILFFMMLSLPFYSLNYIYSTLLSGLGEIKSQTIHAFVCVIIVAGGNLIFSSRYGAVATALISSMAHLVFFSLNYLRAKSKLQLHHLPAHFPLKIILYTLFILACCYGLSTIKLGILYNIIIVASVSLLSLFAIRIIHIKDILKMLKEKE